MNTGVSIILTSKMQLRICAVVRMISSLVSLQRRWEGFKLRGSITGHATLAFESHLVVKSGCTQEVHQDPQHSVLAAPESHACHNLQRCASYCRGFGKNMVVEFIHRVVANSKAILSSLEMPWWPWLKIGNPG